MIICLPVVHLFDCKLTKTLYVLYAAPQSVEMLPGIDLGHLLWPENGKSGTHLSLPNFMINLEQVI